MNLKQLEYFKQICKYQNFTKAAKELYISQPALTLAIHQLEEELQVQLFSRKNKQIALTKEGEYFLERIIPILIEFEKLEEDMKSLAQKKNLVRLGVPLMISVAMYPILFNDFLKDFPDIKIEIQESGAIGIIKDIVDETIDVAITSLDQDYSSVLNAQKLFDSRVCFCVNKNHPFASRKMIKFKETLNEKVVMFNGEFYINKLIKKYYEKYDSIPNSILSTKQLYTIKSMISNNIASAFLLEDCILPNEDIVPIPLEENIYSEIGIITKKGTKLYPGIKSIIQFFEEYYK